MKPKGLIAVMVSIVLAATVAGCGSTGQNTESTADMSGAAVAEATDGENEEAAAEAEGNGAAEGAGEEDAGDAGKAGGTAKDDAAQAEDESEKAVLKEISAADPQFGNEYKDLKYDKGDVYGLAYENEMLGIGCRVASDWTFFSDSSLARQNGFDIDEFGSLAKKGEPEYIMYATNTRGDAISITIQEFDSVEDAHIAYNYTDNQLIEQEYQELSETIQERFEEGGLINGQLNLRTVTFLNRSQESMYTRGTFSTGDGSMRGTVFYEMTVAIHNAKYMALITVNSFDEDQTRNYLTCFYAL